MIDHQIGVHLWNYNRDRRLSIERSMMKQSWMITMSCLIFAGLSESRYDHLSIPPNLLIGSASASYQVEGAWNVSGKVESVWDRMVHTHPEKIIDGSNGDITCDSYHKYKEDVQLMKSIGLQSYRFSISWTRILDPSSANQINKVGLQYYRNLVTELVKNNIQPIVTIFHWDHPQYLEDMGGWTKEFMIDHFLLLTRILFKELGDEVKIWLTVNEPNVFCAGAYGGKFPPHLAPGKSLDSTETYRCMHNILKAHALAYHMYDREFRPTQHGEIAIGAGCTNYVGTDRNDTVSVETAFQFECGWVYHPIYHGDYPELMKERIAMVSKAEGFEGSRLPEFSEEWINIIKGTSDYLSVIHYTTKRVHPDSVENLGTSNSSGDSGLIYSSDPEWRQSTTASWIWDVPWGLGDVLRWIKKKYNNPLVRIMENGWGDAGELDDYGRIQYFHGYMKSMLEAINDDHCNVQSYVMWSLLDDFEWENGLTVKFGITSVDFNDPARTRREKLSSTWWRKVLETRKLQPVPTKP